MHKYLLLLCLLLLQYTSNAQSSDSAFQAQYQATKERINKLKANKEAFPVVIEGDTVFNIYEKGSSSSIAQHAHFCANRFNTILKHDIFYKDSLTVADSLNYILIKYGHITLTEFSEITKEKLKASKADISKGYIKKISAYLDKAQPKLLRVKIIKAVLFAALFILLFIGLKRLFIWTKKLIKRNDKYIYKLTRLFKMYRLKEEDKENAINSLIKVITWVYYFTVGFLIYVMLPAFLSIFHYTSEVGEQVFGYIIDPFFDFLQVFIAYIPTLIKIIIILIIFRAFLKLLNFFFNELKGGNINIKGFYKEWATPTSNIIKFILYAFLLTIIFPLLPGSGSEVFKGVTVFVGLLLSLGSTSVISNGLSGIIMTYMRPFKLGDRIEVDTITGIVVQKNLLITRVRTPKNVIITIPNSKILSGHSKNYTTAAERSNLIIHCTITIGYDVDWRIVHQLLLSAAKNTNGVIEQSGKESFVLQKSLDDFYVAYEINAYIAQADKYIGIQSELYRNILDAFNKADVEIMSPHYQSIRDGSDITIPTEKFEEKSEESLNINDKINKKTEGE
ncbi:mechanosensitive ion channel family protein [Saccharicrinis aurantiacus]|uniref:mechanosensitive ion channel family protein n=1 Tax=Saccharicrinis aurantiacus TaxID=1849719 RepID=UPI0009500CA3|nr:mechanosensitive ion channel family protein [Saccharicrinis aurantiacus]